MKTKASELLRMFLEQREGLLGFIFALTRDREAAEDLFQETGIAVVEEANRGTEVRQFLPWVHEIIRRRVAEHFRKKSRRGALEHSGALDEAVSLAFCENAEEPAEVHESREYLDECLEELPATQRELIEQRYRQEAPLRKIAETADSTEGSVKVLLWRARRQLARCIEGKMASGEGSSMDARRFDELLQRWQDGDAGAAELEELASLLRQDPLRRRELVTSIRLELNLHRKYAPARAAAPARRWRWEAVAAGLVLALSAFLVGRLLLIREPAPILIPALPPKPAPIGLLRAIDLAVASGAGVPVKAEVEREDGSSVYSIQLAVGDRTREVELDLSSGRVLEDEVEAGDRSAVAGSLKVSLAVAIEKALEAVPGRPVEAEAKIEGGKVLIEVRLIAGSSVRKIVVDGGSGQILRR